MNNRIRELKIGSAKIDKVVQDFDFLDKMVDKMNNNNTIILPFFMLYTIYCAFKNPISFLFTFLCMMGCAVWSKDIISNYLYIKKLKSIKENIEIDFRNGMTRTEVVNIINIKFYNASFNIQKESEHSNNYIYYLVTTDMGREFIMTDLNIINKAIDVNIRAKVTYLINSGMVLEGQVV